MKVVSAFNSSSTGYFSQRVSPMTIGMAFQCDGLVTYRQDYNSSVYRKWECTGSPWRCIMYSMVNAFHVSWICCCSRHITWLESPSVASALSAGTPNLILLGGYFKHAFTSVLFLSIPLIQWSQVSLEPSTDFQGRLFIGWSYEKQPQWTLRGRTKSRVSTGNSSSRKPFVVSWLELVVWQKLLLILMHF